MERITEYSGGLPVIPKTKIKYAPGRLAAYENTGLTPEEVVKINDFTSSQCAKLLIKLGSFVKCENCKYCKTENGPGGMIRWCRLANGLDGDLEDGTGCTRGKIRN